MIGGRFGEWFEALSYSKRGLGKMRWLQAKPATGFGGQGIALREEMQGKPRREGAGGTP